MNYQELKTDYRKTERSWTQDSFLNHIRKNKIPFVIFLLNGVKIQGFLAHFDQNVLIIKREGHYQLVYKHAISTLIPHQMFSQEHQASTEVLKDLKDKEF